MIGPSRKKVYAHKCILSGRCEVFRAMFVEQAKNLKSGQGEKDPDGPFVLTDMTHEVFITMMEFIYTNRVTLSSKTVRVYLVFMIYTYKCIHLLPNYNDVFYFSSNFSLNAIRS